MPAYVYRCPPCDREEEHLMKMSDQVPVFCSVCSSEMKKIITTTSFVLKGTGWARDGYSKGAK